MRNFLIPAWLGLLLAYASVSHCNVIKLDGDQALLISTSPVPPTETTTTGSSSAESWEVKTVQVNADSAVGDLAESDEPVVTIVEELPKAKPVSTIPLKPDIYSFKIQSDIKYRYSRTYVTSRVVNPDPSASQEVTFKVVLPETAFISKFIMEIDGVAYEAYVKEKEEAKRVYNQAQSQGQSAGLVELNTRNANVFNVNVNIKAQSKVNFNLTYEELLSRRLGRYEQAISISPDQVSSVKDFEIIVSIEESQNITLLRVPNLRNDVEAQQDEEGNNKDAVIVRSAPNKANITWRPSQKDQSQLGKQGITGKFVVQYDIKRELDAGEVLVMNGYFVHFFAPENLKPLRKHVVFVLDTSGSMWGRRMEQLKEAMSKILADLTSEDFFNILTFSGDVVLWSPEDKISSSPNSNWTPPPFHGERVVSPLEDPRKRQPYPATKENIEKAQAFIQSLVASGGTNIHDSIVQALNLTAAIRKDRDIVNGVTTTTTTTTTVAPSTDDVTTVAAVTTVTAATAEPSTTAAASTTAQPTITRTILPQNVESLIMFLTDGEPTVGVTSPTSIQTLIQLANKNISVPIFALAFGEGADFPFVRKLALQNNGFARKIYEASDAAIQLKGFYNEIASPLLSNVTFNYTTPESAYTVANVTVTKFQTIFGGTEIAVAGKLVPKPVDPADVPAETEAPTQSPVADSVDQSGNQVLPTNQHYFDVYINGFGREGAMVFDHPEVFSSPIPWGIPIRPFPPRPTPVPTQEDLFLERLWAYLTIQQLIEKDLASDPKENEIEPEIAPTTVATTVAPPSVVTTPNGVATNETSTVSAVVANVTAKPETPKQRALRLALKYGFVTSLTSLVVVKPNSSDVTNAEAADARPDVADSLAAPQSISFQSAPMTKVGFLAGGFTANRIIGGSNHIVPLSLNSYAQAGPPGMAFAHAPPAFQYRPVYYPSTTTRPIHFTTTRPVSQYPTPTSRPSPPIVPSKPFDHPSITPTFVSPAVPVDQEDEEDVAVVTDSSVPFESTITTVTPALVNCVTETGPTTTVAALKLSLGDLTWYKNQSVNITQNGVETSFAVAESDVEAPNPPCSLASTGAQGRCVHLKDCVRPVFVNDFKIYSESYFCPLESAAGVQYAGACCSIQS